MVSGAARDNLAEALVAAHRAGRFTVDFPYSEGIYSPVHQRRRAAWGAAMYAALGIDRDANDLRSAAYDAKSLSFYDAPHVALLYAPDSGDPRLTADVGMYAQTLLLAMAAHGVDSCPQALLSFYADTVRETLDVTGGKLLFGISFGYADPAGRDQRNHCRPRASGGDNALPPLTRTPRARRAARASAAGASPVPATEFESALAGAQSPPPRFGPKRNVIVKEALVKAMTVKAHTSLPWSTCRNRFQDRDRRWLMSRRSASVTWTSWRSGWYVRFPGAGSVPGLEVAGRVRAVGQDVPEDLIGTRALALPAFGGYAEQVVASAERLLPAPSGADPVELVALGVNALVAEGSLHKTGVVAGDRALVRGAGGGIGVLATQIAHARGAEVTAVTSSRERGERLRALGAAKVFDRTGTGLPDERYDLIVDIVGGPQLPKYLEAPASQRAVRPQRGGRRQSGA